MYLLGYDIGSSFIKASLLDAYTGKCVATESRPQREMPIAAPQAGWAEQNPLVWWENIQQATQAIIRKTGIQGNEVKGVGISYQMHGLIVVDPDKRVLRPAIIWCDSRAVSIGQTAFRTLGKDFCLGHLLNSPGNFTAAKLAWIRKNEPEIFEKIHKIMLPGDYLAMELTGEIHTTQSGLSEGVFWDFKEECISKELLQELKIPAGMLAAEVPTFGLQGYVTRAAADLLGLAPGIPVTYRAGDQPNNALSLNVLNPGEIASTAGTSGVVYGISDKVAFDPQSRINAFLHVNHTPETPRLGILLCINGTGSLISWLKRTLEISYADMDRLAAGVSIGAEGVFVIPFGNGVERILTNHERSASFQGINFNSHDQRHLLRAAQEGVAFAFKYGMDIMRSMGMDIHVIRAGHANMFLSSVFQESLAGVAETSIEIYDTDGSLGAARGAGLGAGIYTSPAEAFASLNKIKTIDPVSKNKPLFEEAYGRWLNFLNQNQ
ncbi:MAG: hypothetical protein LBV12_12170 [Puniceicoccales bacterium]|jgi:xylulokinase|nr:hypothetical protein [Puniceicoccales bacterium]